MRRSRGEHLVLGDVDVGIRRPATRFGAVAGNVRGVVPLVDRGARDQEGGGLRAVAAAARQLERHVGGIDVRRERRGEPGGFLDGRIDGLRQHVHLEARRRRDLARLRHEVLLDP